MLILEDFCWQPSNSPFSQKLLQNRFPQFTVNTLNSGHALSWHWRSFSAKVPQCSPLCTLPPFISLEIYSTSSEPIEVTYLVIEERFQCFPFGWFLYLWEICFCSISQDLLLTDQSNNLHTDSCMTSVEIRLIPYNLYTLEPVSYLTPCFSKHGEYDFGKKNLLLFMISRSRGERW